MANHFEYSADYFNGLSDNWSRVSFPIISQLLAEALKGVQCKNILDMGCGNGSYGKLLSHFGGNLVGSDVSPESIGRCSMLKVYDELCVASVECLPFRDEYFDVVFSSEVIEHVEDVSALFAEVFRVLKKGGLFIWTTTLYAGSIWTYWSLSKTQEHGVVKRAVEFWRYLLGFVLSSVQRSFVKEWCFHPLGGHYHGFHPRQLRRILMDSGFILKSSSVFFAIDPIPLLAGGDIAHAAKRGFPVNVVLVPASQIVRLLNALLKRIGKGANNIFSVTSRPG